ncbi:MAG: tRNA (adenosine(37)-N6)-threonylcarbamoyltransferase complex dimerization subunit type 1 TsaB [Chloroflexi bacterium]|nr:tRNA (adenosine(37)-N6)-threonylcarbamoyltransferase complex dimerization subunit type 1 TsaB [Chloroflexota bacterium]
MLMAIDTSTEIASVALFDERAAAVRAEVTWHTERNHTRELLPEVHHLLARAGIGRRELTGVAVAIGPGSFNGLRVGLTTAKCLAFALGLPLVGIGTLEAAAAAFTLARLPIRPLLDAGRGQLCTALYLPGERAGAVVEREAPRIAALDDVIDSIRAPQVICGEIRGAWRDALDRGLGELAIFPSSAMRVRRAGYLADLGWQRITAGRIDDIATLQPIYLRRPPVTLATAATPNFPSPTAWDHAQAHAQEQGQG